MEQQLINAFMKLISKAGAGALVKELIQQVDENGNPKDWSRSEMENAVRYINYLVERFGKQEAILVIQTLIRKFDIQPSEVVHSEVVHPEASQHDRRAVPDPSGVQGLQ